MGSVADCPGCHPELLPTEQAESGHVALRFKTDRGRDRVRRTHVWLNDQDVTGHCLEANVLAGYVVMYRTTDDGKRYVCPSARDHAAQRIIHGEVRVELR